MSRLQISKAEAADIVIHSQMLDGKFKFAKGRSGTAGIIDKLGYVQIDTISVINRAHHHVLWTRSGNYIENHLHDLQTKDKLIFEYWTHAMSFIPTKDYRFSLHRMKNFENPKSNWLTYRFEQSKKYFKPVLERIKTEGRLSSSDFENDTGKKSGTWWDWRPAKTALEYLFWKGDLMVAERRGFQKYYDLTERVLPRNIDTTLPDEYELNRFFILRALSSLGVATEKEIRKFMQPGKKEIADLQVTDGKTMHTTINEMCSAGEIIPLTIEPDHKLINYALPENLTALGNKVAGKSNVRILSPFDNLIIQRDRTKRLFDFDYTIECYLPEHKRKFGYFVLPVLYGKKFVGRMDAKADRKTGTLAVNNLVFENNFNNYDELIIPLAKRLNQFAVFNGCTRIKIKNCRPNYVKSLLNSCIKKN